MKTQHANVCYMVHVLCILLFCRQRTQNWRRNFFLDFSLVIYQLPFQGHNFTQTKKNLKGAKCPTKPTETDWKNVSTLLDSRFLYLKQFIANGTLFCKVAYCLIVCLEINGIYWRKWSEAWSKKHLLVAIPFFFASYGYMIQLVWSLYRG